MLKKGILALLLSVLFASSYAQTRNNYYSTLWWNEVNFKGDIGKKGFYQVDFQYRTTSDATNKANGAYHDPFKNMMQMQFRPFFGYYIGEGLKLSIAPGIAPTWNNWRSSSPNFQMEYRLTVQLQSDKKYGRVILTHRSRFEYRMGGTAVDSKNSAADMFNEKAWSYDVSKERYRFRYMLRAIIPLNNKTIEQGTFYVNVYDEVFAAFGSNVPSGAMLDQNRFNLGLGYRFAKDIRVEAGYFMQLQMVDASTSTSSVTNAFHNNGVQVFLIFNNMKKLFKGESDPTPKQ
ncbi:MAG: DUF2490 domain-containing protein [Cytophagaceae bacterium]|nr:DUF2490 domain-containing protein [Cytophagaceae bacterium]